MRSQIVSVFSALLIGCVSARYEPPLDTRLSELGAALLADSAVVLDESGECESVTSSRKPSPSPKLRVTIRRNHTELPGQGWQCFEPYLYVLTLGLVPVDCTNEYEFAAKFAGPMGEREIERRYTVTVVQGWVSGLLFMLPGWQFGEGDPCARAFTSAVNEHAGAN